MKNKYFSWALFYDEMRNIILGSTIANILLMAIGLYEIIDSPIRIIKNSGISISLNMPLGFLYFVLIGVILGSYSNKDIKYSFMQTQPYSKDAIIITKSIGYVVTYVIPLIVYGIIATIAISKNKLILGSNYDIAFKLLFSGILATFITLTFLVMLMQLMQMLFGRYFLAALMPFAIGFMCFISIGMIYIFTSDKLAFIKQFIDFLGSKVTGSFENEGIFFKLAIYMKNGDTKISIILAMLTVLLLFICILLNRGIKTENTSNPYMFKPVEIVTNIVSSITIVCLLTLLLVVAVELLYERFVGNSIMHTLVSKYGLESSKNLVDTGKLIIDIAWIPLSIYMYKFIVFISRKRTVV